MPTETAPRMLMRWLKLFAQDRRGSLAVQTALALPFILGAGGAAVDYSRVNAVRTNMQSSLDAAVLAGVASSDVASEQVATANNYFTSNLNKFVGTSATGVSASFKVDGLVLSGDATGSVDVLFGKLLGMANITPKVSAAATKSQTPLCVLGLNGLDNGSFDINGTAAQFNADCAVQANSNSGSGMTMEGSPTAKATKFGITGGHKGNNYSPPPSDGSPRVSDPYASLPFPYYDDCAKGGKKGDNIKDSITLSPGTYCGGIHVYGNGTVVKLQPGIYVMSGGPFWIDSDSTVTGDQVMIAFTGKGAAMQIWGTSQVTLTSPTSGPYMNMQFFQDWNDDNTRSLWSSIGGNTKLQYDGVAYFPTQNFWTFGDATLNANSLSLAIVADKIWTQGNAKVTVTHNNTRNLPVKVTTTTFGVTLIK